MQCYTILYSKEGYFLLFEKRNEAFFFHGNNGSPGAIFPPNGTPITNGPGLFAFPGGSLNNNEPPLQGCTREFKEECGHNITFRYLPLNQPQSLATLNNLSINGTPYEILYSEMDTQNPQYLTLYVEFSTSDLREIQDLIMNTNLSQANQVRSDIRYNEIRTYNDIFMAYPYCPDDDELGTVQLWQVQREINEIRQLAQNTATDWYFQMIVYLANTILNFGIVY